MYCTDLWIFVVCFLCYALLCLATDMPCTFFDVQACRRCNEWAMMRTSLEFLGSWHRIKRGLEDLSYGPGSSKQTVEQTEKKKKLSFRSQFPCTKWRLKAPGGQANDQSIGKN